MRGRFDDAPSKDSMINEIGRWYKPWFFSHVQTKYEQNQKETIEYIPLGDYYRRHSKSIFWEMQVSFRLIFL